MAKYFYPTHEEYHSMEMDILKQAYGNDVVMRLMIRTDGYPELYCAFEGIRFIEDEIYYKEFQESL